MDPAQRKFLETVYEAVESSGTSLEKLSGSKIGCFVGNFNYDHQLMQFRDTEYPEPYGITGGGTALLSNRVSYVINLQGPSLTLDTACTSSMYALHLACSSIQLSEVTVYFTHCFHYCHCRHCSISTIIHRLSLHLVFDYCTLLVSSTWFYPIANA